MQFTGTLFGPDKLTCGRVSGQYAIAARRGLSSWSGWMCTSSAASLLVGRRCTLSLDDGRAAELKIRWCQPVPGEVIAVFDGIRPGPS
jgi:hypothetical protein